MSNFRTGEKDFSLSHQRLSNRLLYFSAFKLPMHSSYSNRPLINYFDISLSNEESKGKKNTFSSNNFAQTKIFHYLLINNIFQFYL
jgi:hypothetical protein